MTVPDDTSNEIDDKRGYALHTYIIGVLIIITIVFMIIRIIINTLEFSYLVEISKDFDYRILMEGMDNGLINFYDPVPMHAWPPYYLYFWYFMYYPMYLMPIGVGVYVWDILRLLCCIYVVKEAHNVFHQKIDLIIFYIFIIPSFAVESYLNNVNFLIMILLFTSYTSYEKDQKWLAGILFALATFKINSIIFLPILLIVKKIKVKDIIYFVIPLGLLCIPYVIFPDYFLQMVENWTFAKAEVVETESILIRGLMILDSILWKALQPSHLMFIGLIIIMFLENVKDSKWRNRYRIIIITFVVIYSMRQILITFIYDVFIAQIWA